MAILKKLTTKDGLSRDRILDAFTKDESEGIHPPLGTQMVRVLTEELELMGYVETEDGVTRITSKGEDKLAAFRAGLPSEDREAFEQYT
jgi:ribosomal protein S19E (S16A)